MSIQLLQILQISLRLSFSGDKGFDIRGCHILES
jgi:hypothetical protein